MPDAVIQPEARPAANVEDGTEFLKRHGMPVAIGVAAGLIVLLGVLFFRAQAEDKRRDAMLLLATARSLDDLEHIVADNAGTPAAPLTLLKLGHAHYSSGNYAMAMEKYEAFSTKFPKHEMAPAAELGRLHAMEALGRTSEALTGFQAFVTRQPDYFLVPQAIFGEGRCLEQLGRWTDARVLYEQFIAAHPNSPWTRRADELLEQVNHRIARGDTARPPPVATSPETGAFAPISLSGEPAAK